MWQRDEFLELDGNNTVLTPADETLFEDGSKSSLAGISFQDEGLGEVSKGQYLSTGEGLLHLLEGHLLFLLPEAASECGSFILHTWRRPTESSQKSAPGNDGCP